MDWNRLPVPAREMAEELVRFLAGERFDLPSQCLPTLLTQAPGFLDALRWETSNGRDSIASAREAVCDAVIDLLPQLISGGNLSRNRLPEVMEHLHECADCRAEYEQMRAEIGPAAEPALGMVLVGVAWHWLKRAGGKLVPLGAGERFPGLGQRWNLGSVPAGRLAEQFAPDLKPPMALTLLFAGGAAKLDVLILPEHIATIHRDVWRIVMSLASDPPPAFELLRAGIGDADKITTALPTITPTREAHFVVDPPVGQPYWVHLSIKENGTWRDERVQLLAWTEPESGNS